MTNDDSHLPEGPLDPFDEDVDLAEGHEDIDELEAPSAGTRLTSSMIDLFFVAICFVVPATLVPLFLLHPKRGQKLTASQNQTIAIVAMVVAVLVWLGWTALEKVGGGSPGRRLLKLKLVSLSGGEPSWSRLMIRFVPLVLVGLYLVATPIVLLAVIYGTIQPLRRDGLDFLAGTRVVVAGY